MLTRMRHQFPPLVLVSPLLSSPPLFDLVIYCVNADWSAEQITVISLSLFFPCCLHHRACSILTVSLGKVKCRFIMSVMMMKVSGGFLKLTYTLGFPASCRSQRSASRFWSQVMKKKEKLKKVKKVKGRNWINKWSEIKSPYGSSADSITG